MGTSKTMTQIFALRTTANREDQVMDFIISKIQKGRRNEKISTKRSKKTK